MRHEAPHSARRRQRLAPLVKSTPEYLKAMYGARGVKVGVSKNGDYLDYAERLKIGVEPKVAFAEAIDSIFAPASAEQKCRIHQQSLRTWGALHEESPPIPYVLRKVIAKNIWMGSTGNVTKTHYDTEDNINIQLRGRKEIILHHQKKPINFGGVLTIDREPKPGGVR